MSSLLSSEHAMLFIFLITVVITAIMTIVNKVLVNQERLKEIQKYVADHNKRNMKAIKEKNEEEMKKLSDEKPKIMQMQSEMMKMQMPMFAAMLPFFVVFIVLGKIAATQNWGEFMTLPWGNAIPIWGLANGKLGWLGWYIFCSVPLTSVFKKVMGVN